MVSAGPPTWFVRALAAPFDEDVVTVDGCDIHYLAWGEPDRPGIVLVHGGAAHAHWWSHIAPHIADQYRVVALDLSGHGDSGRRSEYHLDAWTAEIMAVAAHARLAPSPIVVGHSMGGFVSIATAAHHSDDLAGIVILDSPVIREDPEVEEARVGSAFRPPRIYEDAAEMVQRFRTVPEQDHYEPYVLEHVARHSIRQVEGGWTWKFDHSIFGPRRSQTSDLLARVSCRVALFRAEHGLVTPEIGEFMYDTLGRIAPVIEVPEAGHHLMLDQPLLVLLGLRTLLADWEHSVPVRTPRG
ncbi:MAG: alpha/beta hydrolase [Acidimicrobiales bacterium]|nr:alpha/beta hydrolase [Acidimicrobiales bacterium]